ncbi:MAG: 16S rRNA (cytosine(967)-C(5))-methyltransferase RsmB [Steroidobacteraceae bacterium]|jgi:16S rRNA (cytosine967-C5)-methyltransferase|nr:16S rRNA (cytosine(967)-C(5))-methyltransferase RsmB [Gammaproteobacteria bacterium]
MNQKLAPGARTLAAAARAVSAVAHDGRSADAALEEGIAPKVDPRQARVRREDASAIRAITLGTLRWYLRLAPAVASLVDRPAESVPPLLRALLITAAHQIEYSRGPAEVSVHLAVDAARDLGLARASGFVNAVLRRFVREREQRFAEVDGSLAVRHAHPEWLVSALEQAWGDRTELILQANNAHPPMTLRVAADRGLNREQYQRILAAEGRASVAVEWLPSAVTLEHPAPVSALPQFSQGTVSVQDTAAQLAAWLLPCSPGQRVLDVCAAPGGKSAHLLQAYPEIELLAVDNDAERLRRVTETFERIGHRASTQVLDMSVEGALEGFMFERILLDAPCSATGVIRRHPDIKLLRRETDIVSLVATQKKLLKNAFDRLAPGGRLLYATCSLLPAENVEVITDFLAAEPTARDLGWPVDVQKPVSAIDMAVGVQLLPGMGADHDGFYYACLGKTVETVGAV